MAINSYTLRSDADRLAQGQAAGAWDGVVNRLREAADEIDRLRTDCAVKQGAIDAMCGALGVKTVREAMAAINKLHLKG